MLNSMTPLGVGPRPAALVEVGAAEISVNESWIGRPFPDSLKALWDSVGHGHFGEGDILGPFAIADLMDAPRGRDSFPFYRTADGRHVSVARSGEVVLSEGKPSLTPVELVRNAIADPSYLDKILAASEPVGEGTLRRAARRVVSYLPLQRSHLSLGT